MLKGYFPLSSVADLSPWHLVGIFWYDPEDNTLFGVRKKELTPQMVEESRAKGVDVIDYPISSLLHQTSDIKQRECGRVAWTIDKFIVLVGKWAEPIKEQLTELLEQEFSLPYFEFVYAECPPIELGGTASA